MFEIETGRSFFVAELDTIDDFDTFVKLPNYVGGDIAEKDGHNWIFSAFLALKRASSWNGTIQDAGIAPASLLTDPNPLPVLVVKSTSNGETYAVTNHDKLFDYDDVHKLTRMRLVNVDPQEALDMVSFVLDIIDPKHDE